MNSISGFVRRIFSDVSRRLGAGRALHDGGISLSSATPSPRVESNASGGEGESIDLLRDTLTSATAPKVR